LAQVLKRILRVQRTLVQSHGLTFKVDPLSNFGGRLTSTGDYEPELTRAIEATLQPGQTFVDIGANEGWYTAIGCRAVGPDGLVIAVEPQERCWSAVHQNLMLNNLFNYRLIPYAVGASTGDVDIFLYPSLNNEASTLVANRRMRHFQRQKTKMLSLEELTSVLKIRQIDLIKIDCEGYELKVLQGAERLMRSGLIKRVILELHPKQLVELGAKPSDVTDLLGAFGYRQSSLGPVTVWEK
jgi:FkbM family methyltransferase